MPSKLTTFWNYLNDHKNGIKIPIIQRDYAQGRQGEGEKRKRFLSSLCKALNGGDTLKLDFVYGTTVDCAMQPLDGQQRLTTLWLLHWYFAARNSKIGIGDEKNITPEQKGVREFLKRFSYETRSSSRDFCERLSEFQPTWPSPTGKLQKTDEDNGGSLQSKANGEKQEQTVRTGDAPSAPTILFKRPKTNKSDETVKEPNIAEQIKNQTWFSSAWIQDPTISSMLRMLSGDDKNESCKGKGAKKDCNTSSEEDNIEAVFGKINANDAWVKLAGEPQVCPICFYEFNMGEYGLTDDLYIKMNARGEQLSACENFKADLLGYIEKHKEFGIDGINFAAKWDNDWTNIFWKKRYLLPKDQKPSDFEKKWANRVDEIFFAFINRFWFNHIMTLDVDKEYSAILEDALASLPCYSEELRYDSFDYYEQLKYQYKDKNDQYHNPTVIDDCKMADAIENLIKILDNYPKIIEPTGGFLSSHWLDLEDSQGGKTFISEYDTKESEPNCPIKKISQPQRVVFFAICKFLVEMSDTLDDKEREIRLERWKRVVWNLVSIKDSNGKPLIRSVSAMRNAIRVINKLESQEVYVFLKEQNLEDDKWDEFDKKSALMRQLQEEIDKATQICCDDNSLKKYDGGSKDKTWEDVIIKAENTAFFQGSIRFLFTDANGGVNDSSWKLFDTKWTKVQNYFNADGVSGQYREDAKLLRWLLTLCNNFELMKAIRYDSTKENWHDILLNSELSEPVHEILTKDEESCFAEYNSRLSDPMQKFVQEFLIKEQIYSDLPEGWYLVSRPYWDAGDGIYDLDPQNRGSHPYFIIHPRINLLRDQEIAILDSGSQKTVRADGFKKFWGVDIFFQYSNNIFRWHIKDNQQECDVYLWDANKNDWATRPSASDDAPEDKKYYCFGVADYNDLASFKNELKKLIDDFKGENNALP